MHSSKPKKRKGGGDDDNRVIEDLGHVPFKFNPVSVHSGLYMVYEAKIFISSLFEDIGLASLSSYGPYLSPKLILDTTLAYKSPGRSQDIQACESSFPSGNVRPRVFSGSDIQFGVQRLSTTQQ